MLTELLTVEKAAKLLALSPSYLYKLIMIKQLPAVKIGKSVRIRPEDLDIFIISKLTMMGAYGVPGYAWEPQPKNTTTSGGKMKLL